MAAVSRLCTSVNIHMRVKGYKHVTQVGRGTVSLADAYAHSYQESKVPLVTPAGKHAGDVEIFFVFASKEVSFVQLEKVHCLALCSCHSASRFWVCIVSSATSTKEVSVAGFMEAYFQKHISKSAAF